MTTIPSLPTATTLSGTDAFLVSQGGVTKQIPYAAIDGTTFASRAALVAWAATATSISVGVVMNADGYAYRYIGSGTAISDMPGWVPNEVEIIRLSNFCASASPTASETLKFFQTANGRIGILDRGCNITTALDIGDLTNTTILGQNGAKIVGSSGYPVLKFGHLDNVVFDGFGVESTYSNSTEDGSTALLYSIKKRVNNVHLRNMSFSNPNSFTSAITFYARTLTGDTDGYIDGLWIEDCTFTDVGRLGITLMNRGYSAADPSDAAKRIYIRRNKFKRCGAQCPAYTGTGSSLSGMALSLDGRGRLVEVSDNYMENLQGPWIENVSYNNTLIENNVGVNFSRGATFLSMDDSVGSTTLSDVVVRNNRMVGSAAGAYNCNFFGMDESCIVDSNELISNESDQTILIRRGNNVKFVDNLITNKSTTVGRYAMLVDGGTIECVDGIFDNTACSASGFSTVRFFGATATGSVMRGRPKIRRGASGSYIDQASSAAGNVCAPYLSESGVLRGAFVAYDMPDSNQTLSGENAIVQAEVLRLLSTTPLTTTRDLTIPVARLVDNMVIRNDKLRPVRLFLGASAGETVPAGGRGRIVFDGSLNSVRFVGEPVTYMGVFANIAALPSAVGAGQGATAFLTSARNVGEGAGAGTGSVVYSNGTIWRISGAVGAVTE